jgi:hypothetical protein
MYEHCVSGAWFVYKISKRNRGVKNIYGNVRSYRGRCAEACYQIECSREYKSFTRPTAWKLCVGWAKKIIIIKVCIILVFNVQVFDVCRPSLRPVDHATYGQSYVTRFLSHSIHLIHSPVYHLSFFHQCDYVSCVIMVYTIFRFHLLLLYYFFRCFFFLFITQSCFFKTPTVHVTPCFNKRHHIYTQI